MDLQNFDLPKHFPARGLVTVRVRSVNRFDLLYYSKQTDKQSLLKDLNGNNMVVAFKGTVNLISIDM